MNVTWIRNGQKLNKNRYENYGNGTFVINELKLFDTGRYTCRYENGNDVVEANFILIVRQKIKIKAPIRNLFVAVGKEISLPCSSHIHSIDKTTTNWYKNNIKIKSENEENFSILPDYTLVVSNPKLEDSGNYKCIINARKIQAQVEINLVVKEIPKQPRISHVICTSNEAIISYESQNDTNSPDKEYYIQYHSSFHANGNFSIEKADSIFLNMINFRIHPCNRYTFQLIAQNEVGRSIPSESSEMCTSPCDVPYENPEDVESIKNASDNLVISWEPMPSIKHHGLGFRYIVRWKRDLPNTNWRTKVIYNCNQNHFIVQNQPTFVRYRIKVEAANDLGRCIEKAKEVIGYSGDGPPSEAPTHLTATILNKLDSILLKWNPVPEDKLNGHFVEYLIKMWHFLDGIPQTRIYQIPNENINELVIPGLSPFLKYSLQISVNNKNYHGPFSDKIVIKLSKKSSNDFEIFQAIPLGSNAFLLQWKTSLFYDNKTKYLIEYGINSNQYELTPSKADNFRIIDGNVKQIKILGFQPKTEYIFCITPLTTRKHGEHICNRAIINSNEPIKPYPPKFNCELSSLDYENAKIKITWLPNVNNAGSNFFVKYRPKDEFIWTETETVISDDFITIDSLLMNTIYEIVTVSVDGSFKTESNIQEFSTHKNGNEFNLTLFNFSNEFFFFFWF